MLLSRPPLVLWRYIGIELFAIFAIALFIQTVMNVGFLAFQLVQYDGLSLAYVWPFLFKISLISMFYTLPISLLFAVTLGFGRMVADREVTAFKSCGVSHIQLMMPAVILGLICTVACDYLNSTVVPLVGYERRNLGRRFLKQLTDLGSGNERVLPLPGRMGRIQCGRYNGNVLENVLITVWDIGRLTGETSEDSDQDFAIEINARRAEVLQVDATTLNVDLDDAQIYIPDIILRSGKGDARFFQKIGVGRYRLPISLAEVKERERDKVTAVLRASMAENGEFLAQTTARMQAEKDIDARNVLAAKADALAGEIRRAEIEISRRQAFALSCLSFLWAAAPLTFLLNNRNRLVPFFVGNMMAIGIFYPFFVLGTQVAKGGVPPTFAIQIGNALLFVLGCILLFRLRRT
jgi:lipopolysaccharide export system permease protein